MWMQALLPLCVCFRGGLGYCPAFVSESFGCWARSILAGSLYLSGLRSFGASPEPETIIQRSFLIRFSDKPQSIGPTVMFLLPFWVLPDMRPYSPVVINNPRHSPAGPPTRPAGECLSGRRKMDNARPTPARAPAHHPGLCEVVPRLRSTISSADQPVGRGLIDPDVIS